MLGWSVNREKGDFQALATSGVRDLGAAEPLTVFGVSSADLDGRCFCPVCTGQQTSQNSDGPIAAFADNGKPIYSWDDAASQIIRPERSWGIAIGQPASVTYSYRATAAEAPADISGFSVFSAGQIRATETALQYWADVAKITFVRIGAGFEGAAALSDGGAIRFGNFTTGQEGAAAFAYYPPRPGAIAGPLNGDVWVNATLDYNATPVYFDYGPQVLLHEIGHAIGLAHPGDYTATGTTTPNTYANNAVYFQDSRQYTIMSYFASSNTGASVFGFAAGPQLHDIAAAQRLYGANLTTRTGDTVYGFNSTAGREYMSIANANQGVVMAIWDGGGVDTLDLSLYAQNAVIDLREEAFSSAGPNSITATAVGNIAIARGVIIENAFGGSGNDMITGNGAANKLYGFAGGDTLVGGDGADLLFGMDGDDVLNGSAGNDTGLGGNGNDTSPGDPGDDTYLGEAGRDTLRGGDGNDVIWGGLDDDRLEGGDGIDWLLGQEGNDVLIGNGGINVYVGGDGDDTMGAGDALLAETQVHYTDAGNDLAIGSAGTDWMLGAAGDDTLIGNAGNDMIYGGDGNDTLDLTENGSTAPSGDYVWGDAGADTFLIRYGNTGVDVILDFQAGAGAGDVLRLIGSPYASFAQVISAGLDVVGYFVIPLAANEAVYLYGLSKAQMSADDFLFG